MYSIMWCSPMASSAVTTGGYFHYLPAPRVTIIPVILLATWWWNPGLASDGCFVALVVLVIFGVFPGLVVLVNYFSLLG